MHLHLAQYNTATLRAPLDDPASASYVALLDEVNAAAEASPGFVWRHGIDSRDPSTTVYDDDPLRLVNASVWESLGHLRDYAYRGLHRDVFRRRREWFDASGAVMWWIPAGTIPTLAECVERLVFLEQHGATPYGFATGQRVEQLVIVPVAHDSPEVTSIAGAAPGAGTVHVAVLEGRVIGAAQRSSSAAATVWGVDAAEYPWLEPALRVHAAVAPERPAGAP